MATETKIFTSRKKAKRLLGLSKFKQKRLNKGQTKKQLEGLFK